MGAGIQACRKIIEDGLVGQPIAGGTAFMVTPGHELNCIRPRILLPRRREIYNVLIWRALLLNGFN